MSLFDDIFNFPKTILETAESNFLNPITNILEPVINTGNQIKEIKNLYDIITGKNIQNVSNQIQQQGIGLPEIFIQQQKEENFVEDLKKESRNQIILLGFILGFILILK